MWVDLFNQLDEQDFIRTWKKNLFSFFIYLLSFIKQNIFQKIKIQNHKNMTKHMPGCNRMYPLGNVHIFNFQNWAIWSKLIVCLHIMFN